MILSVDDEVTIVEVGVILVGIAITWAVYRRGRIGLPPSPRPRTTPDAPDPGRAPDIRRGPNG